MSLARHEGAILITGATGFIGRHITRRFLKSGRRLIALARNSGGISARKRLEGILGITAGANSFEVIESDLADARAALGPSDIAQLRATVETVIHCAGDTSFFPLTPATSRAIFIDGPLAVLQALVPAGLSAGARSPPPLSVAGVAAPSSNPKAQWNKSFITRTRRSNSSPRSS